MNLTYGSRGDEVKKLQQALNSTGSYSLTVDGSYGPKTQAAVRDYQTKNGLKVDGIAGKETLGRLYAAETQPGTQPVQSTQPTTQTQTQPTVQTQQTQKTPSAELLVGGYDPAADAAYQQALSALEQAQKALPTYNPAYEQQLQALYGELQNRQAFTYDPETDPLYRQMAVQYARQGRLAMEDTVGQSAALTGGYGNTYGQTAGQQQYEAYLRQLNEAVPELYAAAYDRYERDGDRLQQRYSLIADQAAGEYSRYQDALAQYWKNVSLRKEAADDAYDRGVRAEAEAYDRRLTAYDRLTELITAGYEPTAEELTAAGMTEAQYRLLRGDEAASASGTGVKQPAKTAGGYTAAQIMAAQRFVGAPVTGKWDAASVAAAKKKGFGHLGAVIGALEVREAEDSSASGIWR